MKDLIVQLVSDAITVGFDCYIELQDFCKDLEATGDKILADKVMALYKSHADDDSIIKFVEENF